MSAEKQQTGPAKKRLGELLVESGLASQEKVDLALKMQVGGNRRLGRILVRMNVVSSDHMTEMLSKHLGMPIIDPDAAFQPDARRVLPRYLCDKFDVLPLNVDEDKNIIDLAMTDPLDNEAIESVEKFTKMAVKPCLARLTEINFATKKHVSFSLRDLFNAQSFTPYAKLASTLALCMILVVAVFTYQFYKESKYGTETRTADSVIYKNHDLMVGIERSGKATLLGRGAYAAGYYSIEFESKDALGRFVDNKRNDLSSAQYEWTRWAISKAF